jgi:hypothetical protein
VFPQSARLIEYPEKASEQPHGWLLTTTNSPAQDDRFYHHEHQQTAYDPAHLPLTLLKGCRSQSQVRPVIAPGGLTVDSPVDVIEMEQISMRKTT